MKAEQEYRNDLSKIDISSNILSPIKGGNITRTVQPKSLRGGGGLRFFGGGGDRSLLSSASHSQDPHDKENPDTNSANSLSKGLSSETISPPRNVFSRILGQK
jgi:hypothetical protein